MAELARDELVASLKKLLSSGNHSDLVITCASDTYNVHKAIVCSQSEFFERAVKFAVGKEAAEGKIDLPDDDPIVVKLLIQFFYESEYDPKLLPGPHIIERYHFKFPHTCRPECPFPDHEVCPHHQCGSLTCHDHCLNFVCAECTGDASPNDLLLHAQMYEIADKYDIAGLAVLSRAKFDRLCAWFWYHELFPSALSHALSSTPDENQGLREILCQTIVNNPILFDQPTTEKLMSEHTAFAYQVMKRQATELEGLRSKV